MRTWLRITQSLLLVCMGGFMACLALSSSYWMFLNPKYSPLTLTTGLIIMVLGCAGLFNTQRKPGWSELLALAVFLCLAGSSSLTLSAIYKEPPQGLTGTEFDAPALSDDSEPVLTIRDQEYLKINLAELLAGESEGRTKPGGLYAFQGSVLRSPALDKAGYIGVGRLLIICCFADAIGVVYLVEVEDPDGYPSGAWVRAAGEIQQTTPTPIDDTIAIAGALATVQSENYVLQAVEVEELPQADMPYIFEVRNSAPFAF